MAVSGGQEGPLVHGWASTEASPFLWPPGLSQAGRGRVTCCLQGSTLLLLAGLPPTSWPPVLCYQGARPSFQSHLPKLTFARCPEKHSLFLEHCSIPSPVERIPSLFYSGLVWHRLILRRKKKGRRGRARGVASLFFWRVGRKVDTLFFCPGANRFTPPTKDADEPAYESS